MQRHLFVTSISTGSHEDTVRCAYRFTVLRDIAQSEAIRKNNRVFCEVDLNPRMRNDQAADRGWELARIAGKMKVTSG